MSPITPAPPPPPPGLVARLNAMTLDQLDQLNITLSGLIKLVRANPPVGRQIELDLLEGGFALLQTVLGDRRAAVQPPPPPTANNQLSQGVAVLNVVITGPQ